MEKTKGNGKQEGLSAEDRAFSLFAEMMIEKIESIKENWQKPWFTEGAMPWPKNLSGREYNGVNALMLMFFCEKNGYKIPRFCTFNQLRRMNEEAEGKGLPRVSVQKGSQSFPVIFPTFTCVHKDTKEKIKYEDYRQLSTEEQTQYKVYPGRQVFNVFNVAQTNLQEARPELWAKLEAEVTPPKIEAGEDYSFEPVDKMIRDNLWICPIVPKLQDRAYFSPSENRIVVPGKAQFKDGESFYGTVFHEMIHSTGVEGVLDRLKPAGFSSDEYAREELVAELGAALVAQRYGMNRHIKEDSCAYIKGWLDNLKKSPQFIKTTLTDVKKATAIITQKIDHIAQKIDKEQIQIREFEEDKKNDLLDRNDMEQVNKPEKKNYRQLDLSFDEPVAETNYDVLLEPESPRKEVEFANVQRVFEESKAFQFAAPNKIRSPRDVAYIFKQLETAAVENAFAVLVKDGRPTVIHLGMGSIRHCIAPCDSVMVADRKINADKIYFVHNHPSGNVHASMEDISVLKHWQQVFGDKMQPGIIINSRSGIFGEFSLDGEAVKSDLPEDSEQTQYPVKLYSFSKLVFSKDYKEAGTIRSSSDVAAFLAGQRLGSRPKLSYLVLATNGSIRANVHTAYNSIHQENLKDLARQITNDANVFGGIMVITYGSLPLKQMQIKKLQDELYQQEIFLQDHINVQMDVNSLMMDSTDMPYKYQSANDDGWISCLREPEISYGKERKEDNPVQGLKDYTREEIKDLVKNHIETVMEEAGLDAQVIGVEIHGSRGRGDARPDSDLDVVVEYEGDMKEDGMFNLLNEDALRIDGVQVDVNPIRAQETGTLQEYMERSRNYDREKLALNQDVQPGFAKRVDEFERIRDLAVKNRGLVMPGLMEKEVPLVYVVPHDFHGERPLTQAEIWAKHNLVGEYDAKDNTGKFFSYSISGKAIEKYLSNSATIKSDSIGVHLSVLKQLPDVIANSAEVEIHPDYRKGIEGKRLVTNGYNSDLLIHRFYGAIDVLGKTYRVKTTIQEIARPHKMNRPHSYEVTKIEMLDLRPSISLAPTHGTNPCVGLAKLLQGIEKSYDPGKKVLEESQKVYQGFRPKQGRTRIQLKNRKRGRGL